MPNTSGAIEASLELAAERCDDITPLVYARLFACHPEWKAQFALDKTGVAKGSMLAVAIDVLLDHVGERRFSESFIRAEAVNHAETLDVSADAFVEFYGALADAVRELAGTNWTDEMSVSWRQAIADVRRLVTEG